VIGAGKISEEHLRFLTASPLAQLVGICDRSKVLCQFATERYGIPAFAELDALLAQTRPDVVHVLTPPLTHVPLATTCLQAGAHVITEKPVALSHAEFQSLWGIATQAGRRLIEDQNYRFNRPVVAMRQWVDEGRLGTIREVEVRMALPLHAKGNRYGDRNLPHPSHRLPAGVLHEFISHLVYIALHFLPADFEPRRTAAFWSNHAGGDLFRHDDLDAVLVDGPCHARLRFDAQNAPSGFWVTVRGSKGAAETNLFQPYLRQITPRGLGQLDPLANHVANGLELVGSGFRGFRDKILQRTPYEGLGRFLDAAYTALAQGTEPPITFADMDRTSRVIDLLLDEANRR
jgi:predicted dehydrogenase